MKSFPMCVPARYRLVARVALNLSLAISIAGSAGAQGTQLARLADEYIALRIHYDPASALSAGLPPAVELYLPDRGPSAIRALQSREDAILTKLQALGSPNSQDPTYAVLDEELEARKALRVCRSELWDLSHTLGWQVELPAFASSEPVATAGDKRRALQLWRTLPAYLRTDMENLRQGLAAGYSVPRPVAQRVLRQVDALISAPLESSPFYSPAKRSSDPAFARSLRAQLENAILPALREYAEFLKSVYLPRARQSLGISALPQGAACYQAFLRRYTTTQDTPGFILRNGQMLVARSEAEIRAIGSRRYGTSNFAEIVRRSHDEPANRFTSEEQLLRFSESVVERSQQISRSLFLRLPLQSVKVQPLPAFEKGTGVGSHYEPDPNDRQPATFWLSTDDWKSETRGAAEITAVHETVPGHHLQIALARELQPNTNLAKLTFNAAFVEGWANYAERLAEEHAIDGDDYERIQRRILAGRSLVIDTGIHSFGWTREMAEMFAMETGMSKQQADDTIDRILIEPGQLTSYEVGGLEIWNLREEARGRLGRSFDLRIFHQRVLEQGSIPLTVLRRHVTNWLRVQTAHESR